MCSHVSPKEKFWSKFFKSLRIVKAEPWLARRNERKSLSALNNGVCKSKFMPFRHKTIIYAE